MTHQLSIALNDDEYAALVAESARSGTTIEAVVHERLTLHGGDVQPLSNTEVQNILYRRGIASNIPTGEDDTADEEAEAERLAQHFGGGKSAAEMVSEDRGPY